MISSLYTFAMRLMRVRAGLAALAVIALITSGAMVIVPPPAAAITAEELLADPALEARARNLSKQLRCLVCQNQSIDDSDAELAQDLRREVRSQLLAGADDTAILETLRSKYGDYVLLRPPVTTGTYVLWFSPLAILATGGAVMWVAWRNRQRRPEATDNDDAIVTASNDGIPDTITDRTPSTSAPDRVMMGAVAALILAGSLGLYLMLGRADLADQPLASRQSEVAEATARATAAKSAAESTLAAARSQVAANPNSVADWLALAMAATTAEDSATEISALQQALRITDGDSAVKAMLAEAFSRAADGQVTIPARELIAEALLDNANEPRALFLSGLAAYQDEDYQKAVAIWQRLQAISTPDAPWFTLLGQNIADAAAKGGIDIAATAGPTAADIAAAADMDAADRQAMIDGMVARLEDRLADTPNDHDGWLRLARAYDVLGRPTDAASAYGAAASAAATDIEIQITALEYIASNGIDISLTPVAPMLERIASLDPDRLELLFFTGHFARARGDLDVARTSWQSLIERLPADSPFTAELREAVAALPDAE